jgi:hypothetical protein
MRNPLPECYYVQLVFVAVRVCQNLIYMILVSYAADIHL